jgi:hypothetical protein
MNDVTTIEIVTVFLTATYIVSFYATLYYLEKNHPALYPDLKMTEVRSSVKKQFQALKVFLSFRLLNECNTILKFLGILLPMLFFSALVLIIYGFST